ncbi:MAG: site-specific integrase [Pseudomonadota bacterium]
MPKYVQLRSSGYYFRYVIPPQYRHLQLGGELRYALKTHSKVEAKRRARYVVSKVETLLAQLRGGGLELDAKTIQEVIREYVRESRESHMMDHLWPSRDREERDAIWSVLSWDIDDFREALASSNYRKFENRVKALFNLPEDTNTNDNQFKLACREWVVASIDLHRYRIALMDGETVPEDGIEQPKASLHTQPPSGPPISEVVNEFLEDRSAGRKLAKTTKDGYRQHVQAFIDVLGDRRVDTVTYDDAKELRDTLLKLPKNRKKIRAYRDKAVSEILAMDIPEVERLQSKTVGEIIGHIKTIFTWLKQTGKLTQNPFEALKVAVTSQSYPPYEPDDLELIFSSPLYTPGSRYVSIKTTTAGLWWLPLILLYSGARPSEIVQMRLEDVSTIDGVLCMSVVDDPDKGQQVKTEAGRRTFPVHPELIRVGFEEYLEMLRRAGAERVLEGVNVGKRKAAALAGKWWNERYRDKHFPDFEKQRKVLYSFRHMFVTHALNVADIPLQYVQQIVGHEKSQFGATRHYDKGAGQPRLLEEIRKVDYGCHAVTRLEADWRALTLLK